MMTDPVEQASVSERMNKNGQLQRSCVDCRTTRTPLWRGGPAGPKSLCNACGIRLRKQKSALLGLGKRGGKKNKKKKRRRRKMKRSNGGSRLVSMKLRVMALGRDATFQTRLGSKIRRTQLGEVERAATLLMSLSSASV